MSHRILSHTPKKQPCFFGGFENRKNTNRCTSRRLLRYYFCKVERYILFDLQTLMSNEGSELYSTLLLAYYFIAIGTINARYWINDEPGMSYGDESTRIFGSIQAGISAFLFLFIIVRYYFKDVLPERLMQATLLDFHSKKIEDNAPTLLLIPYGALLLCRYYWIADGYLSYANTSLK